MATQNYFKAKNGLEAPSQSTIAVTDSNFPTVRPTLNLDFAGSKSVDSRVTFTRASAATYTGADGKLKYAVQNEPRIDYDPITGECKGLLIEEQRTNTASPSGYLSQWQFINGGYVIEKAGLSPDGSMNAAIHGSTTAISYLRLYPTLLSGTTYTFSVWVKKSPNTSKAAPKWFFGLFNLTTGDSAYQTITPTDSWQRVSVTLTMTGNGGTEVQLGTMKDNAGNNLSGAEVMLWGPQVEIGAFPTSYIPSTTAFTSRASSATYFDSTGTLRIAGTNQARYGYGYDSTSGKWVSQGLVLEAASTNLITQSSLVTDSSWTKTNLSLASGISSPDGSTGAISCIPTNGSTGNALYVQPIGSISDNTVYTVSVYIKANGFNVIEIQSKTKASSFINTWFDISSGTVASTNAIGAAITYIGNGWYRCSHTLNFGTAGDNGAPSFLIRAVDSTSTEVGTGNGTKSYYVWGAQVETGYVATSYIPTYGASATRAADVSSSASATRIADYALIDKSNFSNFYNQSEGTFVAEFSGGYGFFPFIFGVDDGTGNNGITVLRVSSGATPATNIRYQLTTAVGVVTDLATSNSKVATAYKSGDYAAAVGSVLGTSSTAANLPVVTTLYIGNWVGSSRPLNGYVRKLSYYPKRIVNTQLQALTA